MISLDGNGGSCDCNQPCNSDYPCEACQKGINDTLDKQAKIMQEYGWIVHFTFDDDCSPYRTNIHTHGLLNKYGHKDFQICFPIDGSIADSILWALVRRIEAGEKFIPDKLVMEIIKIFPITFITVPESDREVLRIIFPDQNGVLDKDKINPWFKTQWEV